VKDRCNVIVHVLITVYTKQPKHVPGGRIWSSNESISSHSITSGTVKRFDGTP